MISDAIELATEALGVERDSLSALDRGATVIRRANILNCLHLGYACLNVDPKTVNNVGNATWKAAWRVPCLMRSARSLWPWCARSRQKNFTVGHWI